jgi:ABC-type sugar transport system substrate-binding protein
MAAVAVVQNMGKKIFVSGADIGRESAASLASGGMFIGAATQEPYMQGVAQALNLVLRFAGKTPPRIVQTPAIKVTEQNLSRVWKVVFHEAYEQDE